MAFFSGKKFKYQKQLEMLQKLGYNDTKTLKKKLTKYKGNANKVIQDYIRANNILDDISGSMVKGIQEYPSNPNSPKSSTLSMNIASKYHPIEPSLKRSPKKLPSKHPKTFTYDNINDNNNNNNNNINNNNIQIKPHRNTNNIHRDENKTDIIGLHLDDITVNTEHTPPPPDIQNDIKEGPPIESSMSKTDINNPIYSIKKAINSKTGLSTIPYPSMESIFTPQSLTNVSRSDIQQQSMDNISVSQTNNISSIGNKSVSHYHAPPSNPMANRPKTASFLPQSHTHPARTPEMSNNAIQQQQQQQYHNNNNNNNNKHHQQQHYVKNNIVNGGYEDDVDLDTDNDYDEDEESKNSEFSKTPEPDSKNKNNINMFPKSTSFHHEKVSAYFASSPNLLDDDFWSIQLDDVLKEKITDCIEDHGVTTYKQLEKQMKVIKPESKIRIRGIFNELKMIRNDLKEEKQEKIIRNNNNNNNEEDKEEWSLEDDQNEDKKNNKRTHKVIVDENKTTEQWIQSEEYKKLKSLSTQIMGVPLSKTKDIFKTKGEINKEASNEQCVNITQCICMHRIEAIIMIYHSLKEGPLWRHVPIGPLISFRDIYGYQQLLEDFQHLQIIHGNRDRAGFQKLCEKFEKQYPCDISNCVIFARHYRDRTKEEESRNLYWFNKNKNGGKTLSMQNNKDIIFQQHCDKIHSYLLHSMLKFDANGEKFDSVDAILRRNQINGNALGRSFSSNGKTHQNHLKRKKKSERYIMKRTSQIQDSQEINRKSLLQKYNKLHVPSQTSDDFGSNDNNHSAIKHQKHKPNINPRKNNGNGCTTPLELSQTPSISINNAAASHDDDDNDDPSSTESNGDSEISQYSESDEEYKLYPGIEEDADWTAKIEQIAIDRDTGDSEIYSLLVEHMGIFRWQALHGFHYDQYRASSTIRPTFGNIKEEVLKNEFHKITTENWNQTLRKAKAFHQSWAGKRIRTKDEGQYEDLISQTLVKWSKDEAITLKEVITLKLYTDFDQLQFELKKCFRWEQIGSLVDDNDGFNGLKNYDHNTVDDENKRRKNRDEIARNILEKRLMNFYHWRMSLQITLKKFGKAIQDMDLYHGVNEKMILYPHATTKAFHGPLSTTASFHVAKTFATDKGMVLKINSMYPRLYHCRAFDASLLSDYPEEQEWLVGFIYTRIRKVHTKEKWDIVSLPTSTQLRFSFFVIHLFKLQVFSLSEDLAEILTFMLEMYLSNKEADNKYNIYNAKSLAHLIYTDSNNVNDDDDDNIDNDTDEIKTTAGKIGHRRFWSKLMKNYYKEKTKEREKGDDYEWNMEKNKRINCRIMSVLIAKFKTFASEPKIVRFDDISYNLRHHFMNKVAQTISEGKNVYRVSFKKIQKIFVNVEEIYLQNYYKLDDGLLEHIIEFLKLIVNGIKNKDRIKQIKFLYYDYKGDIINNTDKYFPTNKLNKQNMKKLTNLGWEIIEKHQKKRNTNFVYGVGIRLKPFKNKKNKQ